MRKTRTSIYFQKRYCLLVHSLILHQRMAITGFSQNSCEKQVTDRTCSYNLNQIVYVNCIDVIKDGVTTNDSEAVLHFSLIGDKSGNKNSIAVVKFDMNQEKIVKPQSTVLYSKQLSEGKGILHYKFINLKTKTLTPDQFQLNRQRKGQLEIETSKDEHAYKLQQLSRLIAQKDDLIQKLQKKIETLIIQNRRIKDQAHQTRQHSKQKTINFNVKVNPFNDNLRRENQKLMMKLKQIQEFNSQLHNQIAEYVRKEQTYERQNNLLRKQLQKHEKAQESKAKSRGRTVSYIQPSFLRNSSVGLESYQSNADWVESQQNPTRITINEPVRKQTVLQQESEIPPKSNISNPLENSQGKLLQAKSSMYASNYLPVTSEKGVKESQTSEKEKNLNESQNLQNSMDKHGEAALNRRISMQKDDLKWTSIIYERNQQIQILKRKLQQKANEQKASQKQIQKLKVAAKKKDAQLKEMQKQLQKKTIFGNGSSGQLRKNRGDLQLQFQKIQAKHDEDKVRLQGQIDQIAKEKEMQDKQIKKLKTSLAECQERSKTIEVKYNELKKFTQKKQEQFIQYRQKSSQYDVISIKCKQLDAALKAINTKYETLQKQDKKQKQSHHALKIRFAQLQRQWERLKNAERMYQTSKNQAIMLGKSVESYEYRYNELKKYCIKAQASFNKYKSSKKKSESEQIKQDKEMQQRFIELAKKMEQTQLNYYKQQIQDYNEEKNFITAYFQKMLKQERDKIFDDKDISEEHKKSIVIQKQKEIERNLQRRLEQIRQKVSKLEKSHDQIANKMLDSKQSAFYKPLPEQIRILQKRITSIQQKQVQRANERRNLKQTITQVNEQLKRVSSSANLQLQSQQLALNKNYSTLNSKAQLMMSAYNDKTQRNMMFVDEARQKSEASHQKLYEQNRKMNTQLVKQNGQLKMKNQKLAMDMQKIESKAQSRQKQLQQAFKKSEIDFKLKNDKLTEQLQKKEAEIENLKNQCADNIQAINNISKEATKLSQDLQMKIEETHQLEQRIVQLEQRIQQYEQGQRLMLEEVNQVKKDAQIHQNQLFELIEQRSNNFARIQKVKQTEIDKWKGAVQQLQTKLEAQMFENIQGKDRFEALKANYQKLEKETQQKIQILKLDLANKEEQCNQIYIKQYQTTRQNETLQQNLMEISAQIENKELELVELTFELTKKTKELDVYKRASERFEDMQQRYKDDIKGMQLLLQDKIQQIRGFQDKYKQFQMEIEYNSKDIQKLALSNIKLEAEAKQYQQKYMSKHEEIINAKNESSLLKIQMQMQQMNIAKIQNQNKDLRKEIEDLNREIQRLNEVSNNPNNTVLRASRKVSNSEFDCPSPGRSRKLPRKAGTLEVPDPSMISLGGTGGITPNLPSPNQLVRKVSDNPFQPKQDIKKSKLMRGTSMQQEREEDEPIAIHIQSPPHAKFPSRTESNVHIDIEDVEESIRFSNANAGFQSSKRPTRKPEVGPQIREQTQQNQQNSGGYGKDIEFGDSDYLQDNEVYQERIKQLQRQLIYSNQENEKLNIQIIELSKKVDQLTSQVSQLPNRSPSLGVSRRRSILQLPPTYPKENTDRESSDGKIERNPHQSHTVPAEGSIRRSNSGLQLNGSHEGRVTVKGNAGQLQQQFEAAQLQIQYLSNELNGLKAELQQSNKNNQRLIEEAQLCRDTIEDLNNKLQEANFQIEQSKHFIQFQELYHQQKETSNHLRVQIEELNAEIFAKQAHISTLMNENCQAMDQANEVRAQCISAQEGKTKMQQRIKQLTQTIQKLKVQYRKYEQSAQLEIVRLHETIDNLKIKINEKQDEFVVLGEELLNIQSEKEDLASYVQQYGKTSKMKQYQQNQIEARCNQLQAQLDKTEQNRQNLYKTIKKLELELLEKDDKQKNTSNESALMMKKYEIKLQSNQEEIQIIQSKLAQKQKIITTLKNQIGLYNEECQQLKNVNDELTYQSTKVEKQLKDIMVAYSEEIKSYKQVIEYKEKQVSNLTNIIKEKQNQIHNLSKNMRMAEKQKEGIQYDYIETKNALEKLKNIKNKQCNDLYIQVQYKNSQCQKLKSKIDKNQKEIQSKQQLMKQEVQKYEARLKAYKQKFEKYECLVEQFQIQLKRVQQRPTTQVYEQVLFENQVLKNRVDELQQMHSKGNMKQKQDQVYMQFRKYKANKDREIQDLNSQMEKYSLKINQLEESMFFLKRQNDGLKKQNTTLSDIKEELNLELEDLKQSMSEVEKELQFYKKRKLLDLQKLLNETQ